MRTMRRWIYQYQTAKKSSKIFFFTALVFAIVLYAKQKWPTHVPPIITTNISKTSAVRSFTVVDGIFLKDGKPFRYVAAEMHYFRIPTEYWEDRLLKVKAAGIDAVQIYVPWNFHEPEAGSLLFSGSRDVVAFIQLIAKLDLLAIVRPGPYICAEWTLGGLPPWLFKVNPQVLLRSSESTYIRYVRTWFETILLKVQPLLYANGGPIIMIQLENEYGLYHVCDPSYMKILREVARNILGPDVILFTTDPRTKLTCGSPDSEVVATLDFGPAYGESEFDVLKEFRPSSPAVNSEFYTGWIDYWHEPHKVVSTSNIERGLIHLLKSKKSISISFYMFHGGTTFGFWNGANASPYRQQITSYDYNAPLSENGDTTWKYFRMKAVLNEYHRPNSHFKVPGNITKAAYGKVVLNQVGHLLANLENDYESLKPVSMEDLGQYEGFVVYKTKLTHVVSGNTLHLKFLRFADFAHIFTRNANTSKLQYHSTLARDQSSELDIVRSPDMDELLVLMENGGYINFGQHMQSDRKGILMEVMANGMELKSWTMYRICIHDDGLSCRPKIPFNRATRSSLTWPSEGSVLSGELKLEPGTSPADTYISMPAEKSRGFILINEHLLGRYDMNSQSQRALYVPRQFLSTGTITITVVRLLDRKQKEAGGVSHKTMEVDLIDHMLWFSVMDFVK